LLDPTPKTNPAKTCTRTRAPAHNINPVPLQFSGFDQTCTATLRKYPFCNICYILTDPFHLSTLNRDTPGFDKTCTRMAKTTPYPPCTVTAFWIKYLDRDRMLRRVTLTEPYRRAVSGHYQHLLPLYNPVIQDNNAR
jgi:hypothetical protein